MKLRIDTIVLVGLGLVGTALAASDTNLLHGLGSTSISAGDSTALVTNMSDRTVETRAPVPVPEPSDKAVRFYRSGIVWWLASVGWSWVVPVLILFSGCSGWLGRQAKRIGRWEVTATVVFVLLYFLIAYVLSFPLEYGRFFVRPHAYGLSNQTFGRWLDHSVKAMLVDVVVYGTTFMVLRQLIRCSPRRWWIYWQSVRRGGGVLHVFHLSDLDRSVV